jgi:glutamate formiminotransferase/formiminotetrahydrofolate cyclodeaminase
VPGIFKECKAVGWYIDEYQMAQISMNLTNYKVTPVHEVFDECCRQAEERGLRVTGSELVGLIPLDAMLAAGRYYLRKQKRSTGVPERELVRIAVQSMGLAELGPFEADQKIIEYRVRRPGRLVSMTVRDFTDLLSTDAPAPGGGSVAAVCGALGAALAAMVANLTIGVKKYKDGWEAMRPVADQGQELKDFFLAAVDRDTDAFDAVIAAMRGKATSDEEQRAKDERIQAATRGATEVPLGVLAKTVPAIELARQAAQHGNPNSLSDAGVAALAARAAARGAYYNVLINLESITDGGWAQTKRAEAESLLAAAEQAAAEVTRLVESRLAPAGAAAGG